MPVAPIAGAKSKAVSRRVSAPPSKPHARGCESLFDRLLNLVEDARGHPSDNDCSDAGQQKNLHDRFTSMDSNWLISKGRAVENARPLAGSSADRQTCTTWQADLRHTTHLWRQAGGADSFVDLFCRSCSRLRPRVVGARSGVLLLKPKAVVLPRPVDINGASAHRLEGAFHADRANVDVPQHCGDE